MISKQTSIDFTSWLRAAFAQPGGGYTDGALLERFVSERDEAAFAVLVKRHGAMVLGVCRRVLGDATDAEDAFQATFLVLVKKAHSLRGRPVIGDWLHGVARRTALKARAAAARRRTVEQRAAKADKLIDESRNDWLPRLDEELSRLPEKYRLPIVLCDLENRTRKEAARQLGWPEGTVAGRIARGRELLAKRLLRGAQAISGIASAGVVGGTAHAAVPVRLVYTTIQAATAMAAGGGAATGLVSAATLTLTKGVVHAMFWSKVKTVSVVLVATAVLAGAGGKTYQLVAEGGSQPMQGGGKAIQVISAAGIGQEVQKQDEKLDKELRQTREAHLAAARNQYEARMKEFTADKIRVDFVLDAIRQVQAIEVQLAKDNSGVVAATQTALDKATDLWRVAKAKYEAKSISIAQFELVRATQEDFKTQLSTAQGRTQERERELVKVAKDLVESSRKDFIAGRTTIDPVLEASQLLLKAELRVSTQKADIVAAHQAYLEVTQEAETICKAKFDAGTISSRQYQLSVYHRIEAEITLDEARRGK